MLRNTHKLVIVSVVILLVLGLTLSACTSKKPAETEQPSALPQAEQPSAPPGQQVEPPKEQAALSFKAKTYNNEKYGFSIQYPDNWVERPEIVSTTIVAAFGVPAFIPGVSLSVRDADKPLTADWIVAANTAEGNSGVKVDSPLKETTLADGTPAIEYKSSFKTSGYDIVSFGISADKDGKRIRATVWTIDAFSPYDEAFFSEIAHTLTFTK